MFCAPELAPRARYSPMPCSHSQFRAKQACTIGCYEIMKKAPSMCRTVCFALFAATLLAQSDTGELRLKVSDQAGLPIPSSVELVSQANQVRQKLDTDPEGTLVVKRLPFALYHIQFERAGFAPLSNLLEIRSALPKDLHVTLGVASIETVVTVTDSATLVDPHRIGSASRIRPAAIQAHPASLPGRSLPH